MENENLNLENLKTAWNNQDLSMDRPQHNLEIIESVQNPIDKTRLQMKRELIVQLISIVLIAFCPFYFKFSGGFLIIFTTFFLLGLGFTSYYFIKFYRFYKKSYELNYNTLKNLTWFKYELLLAIELYKALTFILLSLGIGFVIYTKNIFFSNVDLQLNSFGYLYLSMNIIVTFVVVYVITELVIKSTYGKYLNQIQKVIDQLEE